VAFNRQLLCTGKKTVLNVDLVVTALDFRRYRGMEIRMQSVVETPSGKLRSKTSLVTDPLCSTN
jgi:hypothetical protein